VKAFYWAVAAKTTGQVDSLGTAENVGKTFPLFTQRKKREKIDLFEGAT
jgi:hypothetical protein